MSFSIYLIYNEVTSENLEYWRSVDASAHGFHPFRRRVVVLAMNLMDNNGYRLLLPEGTLDYFIISDVKESASEIVIYLEEKNEVPKEYAGMKVESKGFYEPVVVQDFPIRGKKLFF